MSTPSLLQFYFDGFRRMTLGRSLWAIILLKLILLFAVVKTLFFPNVLEQRFAGERAKAEHVLEYLTATETFATHSTSIPSDGRLP